MGISGATISEAGCCDLVDLYFLRVVDGKVSGRATCGLRTRRGGFP